MNKIKILLSILILLSTSFESRAGLNLPGLVAPVTVLRDANGIPHITAANDHDLFFMQGRIHAEDRLFQMDLLRRSAAGTLAELLGTAVIESDVETRTIGLGRAAERSLVAHPPAMQALLQAYSDGVNSFIDQAEATGQLPPEYRWLELTSVRQWQPLDSVLVGKALATATSLIVADDIDLTVALTSYQAAGMAAGFDGSLLFFEDLFRSEPFDPASTIPDAMAGLRLPRKTARQVKKDRHDWPEQEAAVKQAREYRERIHKLPRMPGIMAFERGDMGGSNSWVIAGKHAKNGHPMLANDMHLRLESPTIFHELQLSAPGIDVAGSSLPGAPCIVRGHNRSIAWGITNARLDVTDIYSEVLVPAEVSSGFATVQDGVEEPVEIIFESFKANVGGQLVELPEKIPVLVVPRRNHGPLITAPKSGPFPGTFSALSVQSVGFGPTRDPEGICAINRASNLDEFKAAIQLIDFASQNLTYADSDGNIGYFVTGEVPLRADQQSPIGPVSPPFLIRNGYAGNAWLPLVAPPPENQATPFEILPFAEMPQIVNPPSGFIVNANNDHGGNTLDNNPLNDLRDNGDGLLYLNWGGRNFSIRAGRVTEMISELLSRRDGKISLREMKAMQADTVLNDAVALAPYIQQAYKHAREKGRAHPLLASLADDVRVKEAVKRLRQWNYTTPTGIPGGYDARPGEHDVDASVAATIYSTWRGVIVANTIDATLNDRGLADAPRPGKREEVVTALKHLLELDGMSVSGLNFFDVPGVADAATRRDIVVLEALVDTLDLLASAEFAPAFARSDNQDDYRWGKLHRIVLRHPLGGINPNLNIPPAGGFFPPSVEGLAGIATDGGFETVDEAPPAVNNVRVSNSDSFMFEFGPTGRFVAEAGHRKVRAESSLAGGDSGIPGNPFYVNLLEPWLSNQTFDLQAAHYNALSIQEYQP
jgi:penicillin amidase